MVIPFVGQIMSEAEAGAVSKEFTERCYQEIREKPKEELEDNEGEDLCNAEFSLAYGAPIPQCSRGTTDPEPGVFPLWHYACALRN